MIVNIILLIVALGVVVKSADWFLGAAEKVGVSLRLPPFILGVILVGFGTSLPELATSIAAVADGVDSIAIANVTGSNIANVLIILGLSTIVLGTIKFDKDLIDLDIPLLVGVTTLFILLLLDGTVSRFDGVILLLGFVGYIVYSIGYKEDKEHHKGLISMIVALSKGSKSKVEKKQNLIGPFTIVVLLGSIALLGVASKVAVDNLLGIVEQVNIGVSVISFFALAIGTSLPELVVSFKALHKGQGDLVVGNIIGSCMFNILLIIGVTSVISPQTMDSELLTWSLVGIGLSTMLLMAGSISKRIHLWEGLIYVLIYVALATKILEI